MRNWSLNCPGCFIDMSFQYPIFDGMYKLWWMSGFKKGQVLSTLDFRPVNQGQKKPFSVTCCSITKTNKLTHIVNTLNLTIKLNSSKLDEVYAIRLKKGDPYFSKYFLSTLLSLMSYSFAGVCFSNSDIKALKLCTVCVFMKSV